MTVPATVMPSIFLRPALRRFFSLTPILTLPGATLSTKTSNWKSGSTMSPIDSNASAKPDNVSTRVSTAIRPGGPMNWRVNPPSSWKWVRSTWSMVVLPAARKHDARESSASAGTGNYASDKNLRARPEEIFGVLHVIHELPLQADLERAPKPITPVSARASSRIRSGVIHSSHWILNESRYPGVTDCTGQPIRCWLGGRDSGRETRPGGQIFGSLGHVADASRAREISESSDCSCNISWPEQ